MSAVLLLLSLYDSPPGFITSTTGFMYYEVLTLEKMYTATSLVNSQKSITLLLLEDNFSKDFLEKGVSPTAIFK